MCFIFDLNISSFISEVDHEKFPHLVFAVL